MQALLESDSATSDFAASVPSRCP